MNKSVSRLPAAALLAAVRPALSPGRQTPRRRYPQAAPRRMPAAWVVG